MALDDRTQPFQSFTTQEELDHALAQDAARHAASISQAPQPQNPRRSLEAFFAQAAERISGGPAQPAKPAPPVPEMPEVPEEAAEAMADQVVVVGLDVARDALRRAHLSDDVQEVDANVALAERAFTLVERADVLRAALRLLAP